MAYLHIENQCTSFYVVRVVTLRVLPPGPINRCLLLTNLSLLCTNDLILIISQATLSSRMRKAFMGSIQIGTGKK